MGRLRIALVGFGHIGQFLALRILDPTHPNYCGDKIELVCVWNRTQSKVADGLTALGIPPQAQQQLILDRLHDLPERFPSVELIVEVAHPAIYEEFGAQWLRFASVYVGSPTAFARGNLFQQLTAVASANNGGHSLFFPSGALWGASDILKMGKANALSSVSITMRKPPHSFLLEEPLKTKLQAYLMELETASADPSVAGTLPPPCVLYQGPIRELCFMAPNNVNTMACLAIASGDELGFDKCEGTLIADPNVAAHIIDICVKGKPAAGRNDVFEVNTRRYNPCDPNQVTGSATYPSFLYSLLKILEVAGAQGSPRNGGVHFV